MNDEPYQSDLLDDLSGDVRVAVERLKRLAIPEAAMQRALDRAKCCDSALHPTNQWLRSKAGVIFGGLADLRGAIDCSGDYLDSAFGGFAGCRRRFLRRPWIPTPTDSSLFGGSSWK